MGCVDEIAKLAGVGLNGGGGEECNHICVGPAKCEEGPSDVGTGAVVAAGGAAAVGFSRGATAEVLREPRCADRAATCFLRGGASGRLCVSASASASFSPFRRWGSSGRLAARAPRTLRVVSNLNLSFSSPVRDRIACFVRVPWDQPPPRTLPPEQTLQNL